MSIPIRPRILSQHCTIDIVEIWGGSARISTLYVRKRLKVGKNFDLVTKSDLNDPYQQQLVVQYFIDHKPLVAVMSPQCPVFGFHTNMNCQLTPEGLEHRCQTTAPHGPFCGELALLQERNQRFFLLVQRKGSWLYEDHPWNIFGCLPTVFCITIHQCMLGQLGPNNLPAKKPTELVANRGKLLEPFANCRCDGSHTHDCLDGGRAKTCERWPLELAKRICDGIILLNAQLQTSFPDTHQAFPAIGIDTSEHSGAAADEACRRCPGCRGRKSKFDPRHIRIREECRWPDIEQIIWKCPGCSKHRVYGHPDHTCKEDCKHAVIAHRAGVPRKGRHPRSPSTPATASMSADLQPQLADGSDLGAVDETRARDACLRSQRQKSFASSSTAPGPRHAMAILPLHSQMHSSLHCRDMECIDHLFRTTWALVDQKWIQLELAIKWNEL